MIFTEIKPQMEQLPHDEPSAQIKGAGAMDAGLVIVEVYFVD